MFEKVYRKSNNHLQSLYNMIAISFKTRVFKNVMLLAKKEYEKNQKYFHIITKQCPVKSITKYSNEIPSTIIVFV